MKTLNLKNVTLCAVACTKVPETIHAMKESMRGIEYAEAILITHEDLNLEKDGIKVIKIERLDYKGYNHFIIYRLKDYIQSDFVLVVQNDGYVLRPNKWNDEFFKYDYIGAPWRKNVHFTDEGRNIRVGNGGFSFRSKKLLHIVGDLNIPFTDFGTGYFHEDGMLCIHIRKQLEENNIQFAPVEIASVFSRERWCSDSKLLTFGFHNNRKPFLKFLFKKIKKQMNGTKKIPTVGAYYQ